MTGVHPAAAELPMLPDDELQALADHIRANGLLHPIVRTPDGRILDGRNRLAACEIAGVEPTFVEYAGDPDVFVLGENNRRRHITTGARAMWEAQRLAAAGKRGNGRWRRGAIANDGSVISGWAQRMKEAGFVLDQAPDLAAPVIAGTLALNAAHQQATERQALAQSHERRLGELGTAAPDLAELVKQEQMALAEAEAAQRERVRKAEEERRDARNLLQRVSDLAAMPPREVDAWAEHLGTVTRSQVEGLRAAIAALTRLAERINPR